MPAALNIGDDAKIACLKAAQDVIRKHLWTLVDFPASEFGSEYVKIAEGASTGRRALEGKDLGTLLHALQFQVSNLPNFFTNRAGESVRSAKKDLIALMRKGSRGDTGGPPSFEGERLWTLSAFSTLSEFKNVRLLAEKHFPRDAHFIMQNINAKMYEMGLAQRKAMAKEKMSLSVLPKLRTHVLLYGVDMAHTQVTMGFLDMEAAEDGTATKPRGFPRTNTKPASTAFNFGGESQLHGGDVAGSPPPSTAKVGSIRKYMSSPVEKGVGFSPPQGRTDPKSAKLADMPNMPSMSDPLLDPVDKLRAAYPLISEAQAEHLLKQVSFDVDKAAGLINLQSVATLTSILGVSEEQALQLLIDTAGDVQAAVELGLQHAASEGADESPPNIPDELLQQPTPSPIPQKQVAG